MNNRDLSNELRKIANEIDPYSGNVSSALMKAKQGLISRKDGQKFVQHMQAFLEKHPDYTEEVLRLGLLSRNEVKDDTLEVSGIKAQEERDRELRKKHGL